MRLFTPVRRDYFYDNDGRAVISLIRKLIKLRKQLPQFKKADGYYFYNHYDNYLAKNILLFHRVYQNRCTMVALNFGDWDQNVPVQFPLPWNYTELLDGFENLENIEKGKEYWLKIPSNYARLWDRNV